MKKGTEIAQMVKLLFCNQWGVSSSHIFGISTYIKK